MVDEIRRPPGLDPSPPRRRGLHTETPTSCPECLPLARSQYGDGITPGTHPRAAVAACIAT